MRIQQNASVAYEDWEFKLDWVVGTGDVLAGPPNALFVTRINDSDACCLERSGVA